MKHRNKETHFKGHHSKKSRKRNDTYASRMRAIAEDYKEDPLGFIEKYNSCKAQVQANQTSVWVTILILTNIFVLLCFLFWPYNANEIGIGPALHVLAVRYPLTPEGSLCVIIYAFFAYIFNLLAIWFFLSLRKVQILNFELQKQFVEMNKDDIDRTIKETINEGDQNENNL